MGNDVLFEAPQSPVRIGVGAEGRLSLGRRVFVNPGVTIHAEDEVLIGDRVVIGDLAAVWDTDYYGRRFNKLRQTTARIGENPDRTRAPLPNDASGGVHQSRRRER